MTRYTQQPSTTCVSISTSDCWQKIIGKTKEKRKESTWKQINPGDFNHLQLTYIHSVNNTKYEWHKPCDIHVVQL